MDSQTTSATPIETWFRRVGKLSIGVVLFLILVGGIVRSTGSGMGCPDWPKCFGLLVPPTEVSEIPSTFFESHPGYETRVFNAFQTWVEYVNRLIGALTGLILLVGCLLSFNFVKKDWRIPFASTVAFVLTLFEAWLGKLVVDRNLEGGMVTLHMFGALCILAALIFSFYLVTSLSSSYEIEALGMVSGIKFLGIATLILLVVQIMLGTQVREQVDEIAGLSMGQNRNEWVNQLDWVYSVHRVGWVLVMGLVVVWFRKLMNFAFHIPFIKQFSVLLLAVFAGEVLLGVLLSNFGLPAVLQPFHLWLSAMIFAVMFGILLPLMGIRSRDNQYKSIVTSGSVV